MVKKIILFVLTLAALAACSKEDHNPLADAGDDGGRSAVAPSAAVGHNLTSTAVTGSAFPQGNDVFRLCAFLSGDDAPTNWSVVAGTEAFENVQVDCASDGVLTLSPAKYYPPTGAPEGADKLWFYAYAPAGAYVIGNDASGPKVNYTITGRVDIMSGAVTNSNGFAGAAAGVTQKHPAFNFKHLLKRVTFKVKAGATFDPGDTKVEQIVIKNVRTSATLDVITGMLAFSGDATHTLALDNLSTPITGEGATVPGSLMFEAGGTEFTVSVTAGGTTYADATVTLTGDKAGEAGVSHEVTLIFNRNTIVPTATITPWIEGDPVDVPLQ